MPGLRSYENVGTAGTRCTGSGLTQGSRKVAILPRVIAIGALAQTRQGSLLILSARIRIPSPSLLEWDMPETGNGGLFFQKLLNLKL